MEDPGMDALRGGFGAVGSIIRARSVSRRLSSASSFNGKRGHPYESSGNLSTHGLPQLQRYQREPPVDCRVQSHTDHPSLVSDVPMPADAMDQISLHTGRSPRAPNSEFQQGYFPTPKRSKSHLKVSPIHQAQSHADVQYSLRRPMSYINMATDETTMPPTSPAHINLPCRHSPLPNRVPADRHLLSAIAKSRPDRRTRQS